MNNQYNIYNPDVPIIQHTDWASVAKQWASLRATVNIPQPLQEHPPYHNIPPPPPPSPPRHPIVFPQNDSYNNYQPINNHSLIPVATDNSPQSSIPNNQHQNSQYTVFEDKVSSAMKLRCETFDYNHGNRPYEYYNSTEPYKPPVTSISYSTNIWNMPPPDHPDIRNNSYHQKPFTPPELAPPPKLFPIININDFHVNNAISRLPPELMASKKPQLLKAAAPKMDFDNNKLDNNNSNMYNAARPTKGLPAWIIDDMKKMKEKERKKTNNSMDIYKDNPVYSRRDSEGDVVMEDVNREVESDVIVMSGKNVSKHQIDNSATETDIDDVSLHGDDEISTKIDYSSKSLIELVGMLDENELVTIKVTFIRDSLTEVMKEITDDMIFGIVKSTFSRELSRGKKMHKHKGKSGANDPPAIKQQGEVMSQLLGLDVYESDDDHDQEVVIRDSKKQESGSTRETLSSNKKNIVDLTLESDKTSKTKSSRDKNESDKTHTSHESSSKRKHRSRSHDTGRSKEKRRSHKKSKKDSDSNEKWNHDNFEKGKKKH